MLAKLQKSGSPSLIHHMTSLLSVALVLFATLLASSGAYAANPAEVPKKKQTTLGLYYTAAEAYDHMQKHGDRTLFIDVRDPIEVNFTGMPAVADANVPLKFADTSKWSMEKKQFGMKTNPNFVAEVGARLEAKGLTKSDAVIVMCRSGPRSAKAANALAKAGYTKVYNLIEGFEGDAVKEGPNKGQRTLNGWKNAHLPWVPPKSLDVDKMYGGPAHVVATKK